MGYEGKVARQTTKGMGGQDVWVVRILRWLRDLVGKCLSEAGGR